ncbi:helix-turn-helix domain-containing protein [Pseudomonas aeruginosa]|uniref:helix-turn-helix domain-containing protein n=1 Tax=Pseudomonas aeruginosa TaxID=287 RepID=UPI0018DF35A1|nr:cupin domain-containing protein [Pseudomonas aeruginosa]MCG7079563.1 cupin domain-containing protein [Pseudomonas aeruginosa]MCG7087074.1 cupin domain-containing protein [Pseudomonas aeruginosa]MCG7092837.1 cupin domain-containing protein [Pseudomonas aeruginosa]MCG7098895.1 cupin domain-containing protein [Pseudomonas aeruginosa]MCG7105551.1 cupin domain-containing protein [Pseudomonas aeruginosa]
MNDHVAGLRIKYLRKKKGLSLQQVADHIGRSIGFVSQIERGISRPSIEDIGAIAQLLEVDYLSFFTTEQETPTHPVVVRRKERSALDYRGGIKDQLLSPDISGKFHMLLTEIAPGASSSDDLMQDVGEQGGLILEGELELNIDGDVVLLTKGDSFQFTSSTPHSYINKGEKATKVMWVFSLR